MVDMGAKPSCVAIHATVRLFELALWHSPTDCFGFVLTAEHAFAALRDADAEAADSDSLIGDHGTQPLNRATL